LEHVRGLTHIQLSRKFRKMIQKSSPLQFTIALEKWRMVSVSDARDLACSVRLHSLREREHAWQSLGWRSKYTVKLPNTGSIYEFIGGVYGNGGETETKRTTSLAFYQLPSSRLMEPCQPVVPRSWVHYLADLTIADFTMDPLQDLLVLVALAPSE
jgi:hypothetical protein